MNAIARIENMALIPFDDVARMGQVMAQSKLFGIQNEQQAIALMLLCQSENLHPATAMRDYHLIQGRPALKADAMLARFQAAGGKVKWITYTDEKVEGIFTHPAGDTITIEWTPQRVARAQIKNDMHAKYPRQMLKARCISEGIRAIYPGVLSGMYAPEEVQEMTFEEPPTDPSSSLSRTEQAKSKLLAQQQRAKIAESLAVAGAMPPLDVDLETGEILEADHLAQLLADIRDCRTQEQLETHRSAVSALKGDAKRQAVDAWKAQEIAIYPADGAA